MTGRDLIIYILENGLEDEPVFNNGKFIGTMTDEEVAVIFGVGVATIRAMADQGIFNGIRIGETTYIFKCDKLS